MNFLAQNLIVTSAMVPVQYPRYHVEPGSSDLYENFDKFNFFIRWRILQLIVQQTFSIHCRFNLRLTLELLCYFLCQSEIYLAVHLF